MGCCFGIWTKTALPSPITPEHPIPKLRVLQRAPPHTQYCTGHQQPTLQDTISLGVHSHVQTLQYFKLSHQNKCQSEKKWRLVSGRKPLKCKTAWSGSPVPSSLLSYSGHRALLLLRTSLTVQLTFVCLPISPLFSYT